MRGVLKKIISNQLAKTSLFLLFLQIFTLIISTLGNFYIAKIYPSAAEFGEYNFYFSLITTFGYSAVFGMDAFILKENTYLIHQKKISNSKSLIYSSFRIVVIFSFFISVCLWLYFYITSKFYVLNISIVCLGVFIAALLSYFIYLLRSLGQISIATILDQNGKVWSFYLILIFLYCFLHFDHQLNIGILSFVLALSLCLLVAYFYWLKEKNQNYKHLEVDSSLYTNSYLLKAGFWFFLFDLSGNFSLNIDVFIAEKFYSDTFLGYFSFYKKLSQLPFIAIMLLGSVYQNKYIQLYHDNDFKNLQKYIYATNRFIFGISLLGAIVFLVLFYKVEFIQILFNQLFFKYMSYSYLLLFLVLVELILSLFGPNILFMSMVNLEKESILICILHIIIFFVLCFIFKNFSGENSFLYSYIFSRVIKNFLSWKIIKSKLGINFFVI
ncbi:MAG: hypothetical protein U0V72_03900 [Cytophagales bacterium]